MNINKSILTNIFLICVAFSGLSKCRTKINIKAKRDLSISSLPSDYQSFLELVKPITVKRVSGTPENRAVANFISTKMRSYGWSVEFDTFTDNTPLGKKQFSNIIATYQIGKNLANVNQLSDKRAAHELNNRVVFACHYDSKFFPTIDFLAATDSAVPCAMLLDLAKFLQENFRKSDFANLTRHLQFIFFDGEEAFVDWTPTDSIYGSRNYAKVLRQRYQTAGFDSMELFVLLDLLGAEKSTFMNFFPDDTGNVYNMLSHIETTLISKKLLNKKSQYYFKDSQGYGRYNQIEDDHKPFLKEGVPILHLIPVPFPDQWHTVRDNLSNLSQNNIQDLRMILKYFLMSILNTESNEKETVKHLPDDEF